MFARGYFPGRSGQVFVVPREGDIITERDPLYVFMHGSPWDYDTRIPHPVLRRAVRHAGQWQRRRDPAGHRPDARRADWRPAPPTYTGRVLVNAVDGERRAARASSSVMVLGCYARGLLRQPRRRHADAHAHASRGRVVHRGARQRRCRRSPALATRPSARAATRAFTASRSTPCSTASPARRSGVRRARSARADGAHARRRWNLATDGEAVIIGQGGAIRATAGLVGRGSCLVGAKR